MAKNITSDPPKAHKGPIQKDLIFLRHTFVLCLDRSHEGFDQDYAKSQGQKLPNSAIKDALVICLDIGVNCHTFAKQSDYQIGLSILDTRHLQSLNSDEKLFQTRHFCVGTETYFLTKCRSFYFGKSEHTTHEQVCSTLETMISGRDIVLVVYRSHQMFQDLRLANIQLQPLYIINAQKAAQHLLDLESRCSLKTLLTRLNCPSSPEMLHNAGNNAKFTLQASLLIAALDASQVLNLESKTTALISTLETTARAQIPLNDFPSKIKSEAKEKRNTHQKELKAQIKEQQAALARSLAALAGESRCQKCQGEDPTTSRCRHKGPGVHTRKSMICRARRAREKLENLEKLEECEGVRRPRKKAEKKSFYRGELLRFG
ncbi:hypothetical protein LSUE1_G010351, partial [Lachnellula suecica]